MVTINLESNFFLAVFCVVFTLLWYSVNARQFSEETLRNAYTLTFSGCIFIIYMYACKVFLLPWIPGYGKVSSKYYW